MRPKFLQRTIEKHTKCDLTYRQWQDGIRAWTLVEYQTKPARWPIAALVAATLLFCVAFAHSAEPGKPFVPPKETPELRLVVDAPLPPSSSPANCPLDGTVLIDVDDGSSHFGGSGTCIQCDGNTSLIITCSHTWRGVKDPSPRVTHGKSTWPAEIIKADDELDLAILKVNASLPVVPVADSLPPIGTIITSCGATINGQSIIEKMHTVTKIERDGKPPFFETDGNMQWSGRSGGGAFWNGRLCGTIIGFRNDSRQSLYTTVESIKAFLPVSASPFEGVRQQVLPQPCRDTFR